MIRRLLRRDWQCQGCGGLGSRKWLHGHPCEGRTELEAWAKTHHDGRMSFGGG